MGIKGEALHLDLDLDWTLPYVRATGHWKGFWICPIFFSGYRGEEVHKESLTVREREGFGRGERENLNAKPSVRFSPFNKPVTHRAATDYYNVWVDESMHE